MEADQQQRLSWAADTDQRVRREQLRLLARHLHVALPGSLAIASMLVWGFGEQAGSLSAYLWFGVLTLVAGARLLLVDRLLRRIEGGQADYGSLRRLLLGGAFVSGCIWGLGGVLFFDPANEPGFALLVIVLGGVVAGSLGPHSYFFANYAAYAVPTMTPLIVMALLQGEGFFTLVGLAMAFFLAFNLYYSKQYEAMALKSIRLQFSNEALLQELQRSNEQLRNYSYTDSLTGIANRRRFDMDFDQAWHRAATAGRPLSLLLLDVDHFKKFNDRHGHSRGDQVLRDIAGILEELCRDDPRCGSPARIGGEEFAIVLEMDAAEAAELGHFIRGEIETRMASQGPAVTASLGVATLVPTPHCDPLKLFQAADVNLYRAKEQGRNRVVAGDGQGGSNGA